ncbi:proteasome-activating nucleotidase [Lophiotrema nucula]|uniref:Proteasome-activating nucleotidase n=1 Tax=Lophiotrema nucula TaxID=690887 RepID=A0A6A5Z6Q1_9PLEO|nr:proteasome-activating nucleotidase [Lophiotrema nucula]
MPAAKDFVAATADNSKSLFEAFRAHSNGTRTDTKSTLLNLFRNAYPDYHVTETPRNKCSLTEYADAGKAVMTFDADEESFNSSRVWKSVGDRMEKKLHPGKLDDDFRFVRSQYIWEDKEFLVYYITWRNPFENLEQIFYVLHPKNESNIVDGHCTDTDALLLAAGKWTSELHEEIWVFDNSYWDKSKELWKAVNGSSWEDVILDPEMKKNLIEDVQGFFDNQNLYSEFAVPWKRGIILHGVPGNGKTVSIKALMSSLYTRADNIPSLYVKSFSDRCNGEQYSIKQIFAQARASAPCLLIFEDLDSLVGDDIRSYFLNEVDGLESNDGILMIGSTNHLDRLDPAISKRPSRFDRKYHFKLPGEDERAAYAEYWRKKLAKNPSIDFPEGLSEIISKLTEGFSFAYMKELFVMSLLSLARGVKLEDFEIIDAESPPEPGAKDGKASEPSASTETKDKPEKLETCTCASTCKDCGKAKPEAAKKAEETAEKKKEVQRNKMIMPTVEIPEDLVENTVLKIVKMQIRILHQEMDNTKEEAWPSGKKGVEGGKNRRTRVVRRAANCC